MRSILALCLIAGVAAVAGAAQKTLVLLDSPQYRNTHSAFFKSLAGKSARPTHCTRRTALTLDAHFWLVGCCTDRGHALTFTVAGSEDTKITLSKFGDFFYDNLVLFAPTAEGMPFSLAHVPATDQLITDPNPPPPPPPPHRSWCVDVMCCVDFGSGVSTDAVIKFIDSGRNVLVAVSGNVSEPVREIANDCGIDFDEAEVCVLVVFTSVCVCCSAYAHTLT